MGGEQKVAISFHDCKFSTEEIMVSRNFNLVTNFPEVGDFQSQIMCVCFLKEIYKQKNFPTD